MIKQLTQCLREYKRAAIITPIFIVFEVVLECIIPLIIANLVNEIQGGCGLDVIGKYGVILIYNGMPVLAFWRTCWKDQCNCILWSGKEFEKRYVL